MCARAQQRQPAGGGAIDSLRQSIHQSGASISYDALPDVFCDPELITIAFASIIENSIKFRSPAVPEVRISAITKEDGWVFLFPTMVSELLRSIEAGFLGFSNESPPSRIPVRVWGWQSSAGS